MLDEVKGLKGATDKPDERDYLALHLFGEPEIELPISVDLNNVPSHQQGKTMHCTAYALTHCMEILNTIEHLIIAQMDPEEQWANQLYRRGNPPYMEKEGDSLQNALETLREKGLNNKTPGIPVEKFLITGYAKISNTVDDIKKWLARGYPIYTGSGNHCFALVGYHDGIQSFKAKNSLKNDPFDVAYDKVGSLFSKYIIYDMIDANPIFKDVTDKSPKAEAIKYCLEKGWLRGYGNEDNPKDRNFMPDQPITRSELAQVLFNIFKTTP